jgi:CDGSH-type Zn-finger protein/uncharacterized Fe-S cluster protein YjdI
MGDGGVHRYAGDGFTVEFESGRCLHAAECVRGLPAVFDTKRRPWVQPGATSAEAVRETVLRCPTGALQFREASGALAARPPPRAVVRIAAHGPLYVHGEIELETSLGRRRETRVALCRCGQSALKPFCDDSHLEADFADPGECQPAPLGAATGGKLTVSCADRGPLVLRGSFELRDAHDRVVFVGERAALCRCGGSKKKPFCDATHKSNGFSG